MDVSKTTPSAMAVGGRKNVRRDDDGPEYVRRRAMPRDFKERAATMALKKLGVFYGAGRSAVVRWCYEAGIYKSGETGVRKPIPADFREMAALLHVSALQRHYQAGAAAVDRWLSEAGIDPIKAPPRSLHVLQPPAEFSRVAPQLTRAELGLRFSVSHGTLARWIQRTGIEPKAAPNRWKASPTKGLVPGVHISLPAQAAQHLRRFHSNVYNCEILSAAVCFQLPNKGIGMWSVAGIGTVTSERLIEMATAKGFDRDARARI